MGQLSLLVAILALIGTLLLQTESQTIANARSTEAIAIAGNMMVYRNAVSIYASNHPTAIGTVSDTVLGLPSWYQRITNINHYLDNGRGYVYFPSPQPELAYQILKSTQNVLNLGIKQNGNLINPLSQTNYSIPTVLPSFIPEGSVVYAF